MSARRHRSAMDNPASVARASISEAVSKSAMPPDYVQNCKQVKSILATGLSAPEAAFVNAAMGTERQLVREFVERAATALDTDYTGLARAAGLSPSTITRFMKNPDAPILTTRTLGKIAQAANLPLPGGAVGSIPDQMRLAALRAVAAALGVDISAANLTGRQREWLAAIERIPATIENQALELLRGMADASSSPEEEGHPSKSSRRRRAGESPS